MLRKHLMALAAPKHGAAHGEPVATRGRPSRHRLGQAFCDYLETRPPESIGHAGGVPATVVVTMTLESLLGGLAATSLDTGGRISAAEARRLACQAGIIPAVLGGASQVLDLGRKTRFHTVPQRVALASRDGGCTAEGCDWPPGMCHAHHDRPWHHGGSTDVKSGRLLCPRHHTLAHDPATRPTPPPTASSDSSGASRPITSGHEDFCKSCSLQVMGLPLYQAKAELFKTLGHPARIRILELLSERDHAVHELLEAIEIEPSNLSQQLAVLRRTSLVVSHRRGGEVVYSVSVPEVRDLLLAARGILSGIIASQGELEAELTPAARR